MGITAAALSCRSDFPMETPAYYGGSADRHYLELNEADESMLSMIEQNFGTVIVVLNSTNAMELGFLEDENVDAAIWSECYGSMGTVALGNILNGTVNPSGKTTDTFGYGLSYTTFEKVLDDVSFDGATVTATVTVTNTGSVPRKDVAEIYYSAPYTKGGIEKSEVVLGGFAKTQILAPGASETLTISMAAEDMASYDYLGIKAAGGAYVLEEGGYDIRLQSDSHNMIDHRTITVAKDVIYSDDKDGKRPSDGITAHNLFDDVTNGEEITYLSRADWAGTMPTERAASTEEAPAANYGSEREFQFTLL